MNYSQQFFGKSLEGLTYKDIEDFFTTEKEESDILEFKSFVVNQGSLDEKYKGIYKSICAFLNSQGGILIWGAPEGQKRIASDGKKEKVFKGNLNPIDQILIKDTVVSKISGNIIPTPKDFKVKVIPDATNQNCICVFEVQKSYYRPHQTQDNYYMRLDGISQKAPHHYIEALFKQITYPDLDGYIKFENFDNQTNELNITVCILNSSLLQNETDVSFELECFFGKFVTIEGNVRREKEKLFIDNLPRIFPCGGLHKSEQKIILDQQIIKEVLEDESGPKKYHALFLSFNGRLSPTKSSKYTLDIRKILTGNVHPNQAIIEAEENVLLTYNRINSGITKEDFLKELLGR